jgi:hypothetical protein
MALGFPAGITAAYIVNNAQAKLAALRRALEDVTDYKAWLDTVSAADLEASPISLDASSADAIKSAFADADALARIYLTGLPPGTYPQPPQAYVYASSQRVVIGPLT